MLPGVWYSLQNIGHFGDQVVGVRSANRRLEGEYSTDHARAKSLQVTRIPVEPRFVNHIDGGANYVEQVIRHHRLAVQRSKAAATGFMNQYLCIGERHITFDCQRDFEKCNVSGTQRAEYQSRSEASVGVHLRDHSGQL